MSTKKKERRKKNGDAPGNNSDSEADDVEELVLDISEHKVSSDGGDDVLDLTCWCEIKVIV